MALTVERVATDRDLHAFIRFWWKVYEHDPLWVPPLYFERLEFLDRKKSAFLQHAEIDYFLARRDGQIVGTIAAFINFRHNEFHDEKVGWFGFFEVLPDYEAAEALLETARDWVRARGMTVLRGPAQYSTNEECGLLVDGFDSAPMAFLTYNPRYYVDFIERAGFVKAMDLYEYYLSGSEIGPRGENAPPQLQRVVDKVRRRGEVTTRILDMKRFDAEVAWVKQVYNSAWEKNWGFVPMTDLEFDHLAAGLKSILDPRLVPLADIKGEHVGFGLSIPDVNYYLLKIHPGPSVISSYLAAARMVLMQRMGPPPGVRVYALGVLAPYRMHGVDALLYYETMRNAIAAGYKYGEMGWVLETNMMMRRGVEFFGPKRYKTYRFYDKPV